MKTITETVREGRILICDGAWGTELFNMGLGVGDCPELWNIEHRDRIYGIAKAYVSAGADIIETNSFGGSTLRLGCYSLKDRAAEINRIAAEISREAAGPELHVAGSMGPSGKMLLMGETTESELYDSFSLQAVALEKGGADCALVETMIDMTEFSMAARAVRENTKLEILATASFDKTPNGYRTLMGVSIEDMCGAALAEGASVIGTNCGYGTEMMIEIVREMRRLFPLAPILVQPNAGLPIVADDGRLEFPETPEYMASLAPKLVSAGANIVGGCCGTTSEHTRAIRQAIKA